MSRKYTGPYVLVGRDGGVTPYGERYSHEYVHARRDNFCDAIKEATRALQRQDYSRILIERADNRKLEAACALQNRKVRGGDKFSVRCTVPPRLRRACKPKRGRRR